MSSQKEITFDILRSPRTVFTTQSLTIMSGMERTTLSSLMHRLVRQGTFTFNSLPCPFFTFPRQLVNLSTRQLFHFSLLIFNSPPGSVIFHFKSPLPHTSSSSPTPCRESSGNPFNVVERFVGVVKTYLLPYGYIQQDVHLLYHYSHF